MHKSLAILFLIPFSFSFSQLNEAKQNVERLCSPEFHGRGYVNGGDSIAAKYLAQQFKLLGVNTINGSYFQRFSFNVNTFPGKLKIAQGDKILLPGVDYLVDPASGNYHGTLSPAFIEEKDISSDRFGARLQEILENDTINAVAFDITQFSKEKQKELRTIYSDLMMICPIIILTDSKLTWSVSTQQFIYPLIEIQKKAFNITQPINVTIEARFIQAHGAKNVIGFIPAKKKTHKTIVFSAHYDHLGRMGEDTYFPGGNDNASGTAMLLSLAEYFKTNPSKYNIQFIAFAGEEAGLIGSKYYVEHPVLPLSQIKFLTNLDIMGSGEDGVTVVNATLFKKAFKRLLKINKKEQYLTQIKSRGPAANSDHYWFSERGIPAFFIYTMGPNKHYHDIEDTYSELSFNEFEDLRNLLIQFVGK